jgi:hypothetical protein
MDSGDSSTTHLLAIGRVLRIQPGCKANLLADVRHDPQVIASALHVVLRRLAFRVLLSGGFYATNSLNPVNQSAECGLNGDFCCCWRT